MTRNGILANPNDRSAIETPEAERLAVYEQRWESGGTTFMAAFNDLIFNKASNDTAAEFVRGKIRAMVKDPAKAELLAPTNHPIGTKRICVDTDYYLTYNRPNVDLVDVRDAPIEAVTPDGLLRRRQGIRVRRDRVRDRVRRDDRRADPDGHRRAAAARRWRTNGRPGRGPTWG